MNIELFKLNLNQYFNYIRKVFIDDYGKYISPERIAEIDSYHDVFEIFEETKFKIYNDQKIKICLNVEDFLAENDLYSDASLKDISINGRIYVKFLVDNCSYIEKLVLSVILKPIITYLVGKDDTVIKKAVIDEITEDIMYNYNIKFLEAYPSKELDVLRRLEKIVEKDKIYEAVLNDKMKILEKQYNMVVDEYNLSDFATLEQSLNNNYQVYKKRIGKCYYSDLLYDYEHLSYDKEMDMLKTVLIHKSSSNNKKNERFYSAKKCIDNLNQHLILFDNNEKILIENGMMRIDSLISDNASPFEDKYKNLLQLEEVLFPLTEKMWKRQLSSAISYESDNSFCFLVGREMNKKVVTSRLLTEKHLKIINNKLNYNYGYIYKVEKDTIIYGTSKDTLVREVDDLTNDLVLSYKDCFVEIDNQSESRLLTPEVLLRENVKTKDIGKVILYEPKVEGIFVIYDNEYSGDFLKASELSEKLNLPLIKINRALYKNAHQEVKKEEVKTKIKETKEKKMKLSERLRILKDNILYDQDLEEFKKVA